MQHTGVYKIFILLIMVGVLQGAEKPPSVEELSVGKIKTMTPPKVRFFSNGIQMAITSSSEEAQKQTLQGFNYLHGAWDFEAYRHFIEALKSDPDCLMANLGVAFSLLGADREFSNARETAAIRSFDLIEQGKGSDLERGYAYALKKLIDDGSSSAADVFRKVGEKYPNDLQLKIFEALLRRTGFDSSGAPMPDQEESQKIITELMKKNPDSPLLINTWLMLRTEAIDITNDLEMAKKLCELVPGYPPYQHLLGHIEWRSGNFTQAANAFGKASSSYIMWAKENNLLLADCSEWIKSEMYRAVALASTNDYETALVIADSIARLSFAKNNVDSASSRLLYWEGKTLTARLLLRRGKEGDYETAIKSLPKPEEVNSISEKTKVGAFYQGLVLALETKKSLAANDLQRGRDVFSLLTLHGEKLETMRVKAGELGELSHYIRAFECIETLATEIRGQISLMGPESTRSAAYNWFSAASEKQKRASRMMPPINLKPMRSNVAKFYLTNDRANEAIEIYQEALKENPNDLILLQGIMNAYTTQQDLKNAGVIAVKIKEITYQP
jgi:tetratricopeptide (TPR) repeat protein